MVLLCSGRHVDLGLKGEDYKIIDKYILLAINHPKVELTVLGVLFTGGSWTRTREGQCGLTLQYQGLTSDL